jgi:Ca-activated chloride channel homolog
MTIARRLPLLLIGCVLAALYAVNALAQQQPPFRSGTRTVAVYATVTDGEGRLVPDLTQEDFEIYDNGKLQPITLFSSETQPITVVVMIDRSGSMRQSFRLLEEAGKAFVRRLMPADKAKIGSFAKNVQIDPEEFTSDHEQLARILTTGLQPEGPTPLWNAIDAGIASLNREEGRRVVLVFTDGRDNPGNFKFNNLSVMDVMRRAQEENVIVYAIGLASSDQGGGFGRRGGFGGGFGGGGGMSQGPDPGLPTIAGDTGGGYFELSRADALAPTFARVADELHRQYALGFAPTKLDDKTHKLEIKLKKPGMKARARKSYLAAREK